MISSFLSPQSLERHPAAPKGCGPELQDAYHFALLAADDDRSMGDMAVEHRRGQKKNAPLTQPGRVKCLRQAIDAYQRAGFTFSFPVSSKLSHVTLRAFAAELALLVERAADSVGIDPYTGERPERGSEAFERVLAASGASPRVELPVLANALPRVEVMTEQVRLVCANNTRPAATPAIPVGTLVRDPSNREVLVVGYGPDGTVEVKLGGSYGATVRYPPSVLTVVGSIDHLTPAPLASPLAVPAVHLNGTGRAGLIDQLRDSCAALAAARQVLAQGSPHMRDYYILPEGEAAFARAVEQHSARLAKLDAISTELEELAGLIMGGN